MGAPSSYLTKGRENWYVCEGVKINPTCPKTVKLLFMSLDEFANVLVNTVLHDVLEGEYVNAI